MKKSFPLSVKKVTNKRAGRQKTGPAMGLRGEGFFCLEFPALRQAGLFLFVSRQKEREHNFKKPLKLGLI